MYKVTNFDGPTGCGLPQRVARVANATRRPVIVVAWHPELRVQWRKYGVADTCSWLDVICGRRAIRPHSIVIAVGMTNAGLGALFKTVRDVDCEVWTLNNPISVDLAAKVRAA